MRSHSPFMRVGPLISAGTAQGLPVAYRCSPQLAVDLAERAHRRGTDRYGSPLIPHVFRVAAAVPAEARVVALLHETLESAAMTVDDLLWAGVGVGDLEAIRLLTRDRADDSAGYLAHAASIAGAPGNPGRLARIVKRADLLDRMTHVVSGAGVARRPPHLEALALVAGFAPRL